MECLKILILPCKKKKRSSNFVQKYTYEPIENKIINLMADI